MPEEYACHNLGVSARFRNIADKSKKARTFIASNTAARVEHMFSTVGEVIDRKGYCFQCKSTHMIDSTGVDVRIWSPPCQPYSELRGKKGTTPRTGEASGHPGFSVSSSDLPELETARPAKLCIVEQVPGFNKEPEKGARLSPCAELICTLEGIYGKQSVGAVEVGSAIFIEGSRRRLS